MSKSEFIFKHPVLIGDAEGLEQARAIISADRELLDASARDEFDTNNRDDFELEPIHSEGNPILIDSKRQALIWRDSEEPENPALMVAVLFQLEKTPEGELDRQLCGVVAGEEFQGVLLYRRDIQVADGEDHCCTREDKAMSALVFSEDSKTGEIGWSQRDTVFTGETCKGIFRNAPEGVIRDTHEIVHLLIHVNGNCEQTHDHLPKPMLVRT